MNPENTKPDCSNHPKELYGETDMRVVAEKISDLNYETSQTLFFELSIKINEDGIKDTEKGRPELGASLDHASDHLANAAHCMARAWKTSKKFMTNETKQTGV